MECLIRAGRRVPIDSKRLPTWIRARTVYAILSWMVCVPPTCCYTHHAYIHTSFSYEIVSILILSYVIVSIAYY